MGKVGGVWADTKGFTLLEFPAICTKDNEEDELLISVQSHFINEYI